MEELVVYGLIILVLACFITLLFFMPEPSKKHKVEVEHFNTTQPTDFLVFNYFPNYPVKMISLNRAGFDFVPGDIIIDEIPPMKTKGLTKEQVAKYIQPGSGIRFYLLNDDGTEKKLSDYVINGEGRRVKNIHVGMLTTRYMANTMDNLHMTTTAANANQGSAWLIIHNLTDVPLSFNNGDVTVAPKSTTRYLGYLNQGVTLGTYFKEDSGLFPDYQYLKPYNNLYYGVISDIRQNLDGCLQYGDFNDVCDYGQTLWPFQEGII
ncbi:MAG TPA: hypothetical protein PKD85_00290 [Saprospiraceae bacterium]|nr:hypothetical protein [Saprospiraceae bacterium]